MLGWNTVKMKCCVGTFHIIVLGISPISIIIFRNFPGKKSRKVPSKIWELFFVKILCFISIFFLQLLTMRLVNMVLDNYKAYNPEPLSYSIKYAASHFLSI